MKALRNLLAVALVLAFLPNVQATPAAVASGTGGTVACQDFTITAVATVVAAGNIDVCINFPTSVSSNTAVYYIVGEVDSPGTVSGTTTFTWTISGVNGCTTGTETKVSTSNTATSGGTDYFPVTMTSNQCRGNLRVVVASGATPTTLITWDMIWNTIVPFANSDNQNRICDESALGAGCNQLDIQVDNQNRLCAASTLGATCTTPTINEAVTGTLTVTNAGGQAITVSGTLDNLNRICAASATGSSCTIAYMNNQVTGTLDAQTRLCNASALGAACKTPNLNTTQVFQVAIGNVSMPNHLDISVHQDQACGSITPCKVTDTLTTTALSDQAMILVPLLLVLILVLWAEKTKNPILYLVAVLTLALTIVSLWAGLVGYRTSLVVVLAFLAFRLYLTAKDVNDLEN